MSRGLGVLQRYLFSTLARDGEPLTFAEILKLAYPPEPHERRPLSYEIRSLRRALHKMVKDEAVLTIGAGGPSNPYRYCLNPAVLAFLEVVRDIERRAADRS